MFQRRNTGVVAPPRAGARAAQKIRGWSFEADPCCMVDASDAHPQITLALLDLWREDPVRTLGFGIWNFLVPVRGFAKGWNVKFEGIAA